MTFPERSVKVLLRALQNESPTEFQVNSVLKYKDVDVSSLEPFLSHSNLIVKQCAARVISARGDVQKVIDLLLTETDDGMRIFLLDILGEQPSDYSHLYSFIDDENPFIREAAFRLFRRVKASDPIFSLLFSEENSQVSRAKRYFDGQEEKS